MSTNDLLTGYDMVAALTQNFINSQLAGITQPPPDPNNPVPSGANPQPISNSFTMPLFPNADPGSTNAWTAVIVNSMTAPTVQILANNQVTLTIHITDGTIQCYEPHSTTQMSVPIQNLDVSFTVNMNLAPITDFDTLAAPQDTITKLKGFSPSVFSIQYLALDFESSQLMSSFSISSTNFDSDSPQYKALLNCFSTFYSNLGKSANPYVFGYPVSTSQPTEANPTLPLFAPTSCEFSTTVNAQNPGLSTLNYCIMTDNSPFPTEPDKGIFSPWVTDPNVYGQFVVDRDIFVSGYLVPIVLTNIRSALNDTDPGSVWSNNQNPNEWNLYLLDTNIVDNNYDVNLIKVPDYLDYYYAYKNEIWSNVTLGNDASGNLTITAACKASDYAKVTAQIMPNNWFDWTVTQDFTLTVTFSPGSSGSFSIKASVTTEPPQTQFTPSTEVEVGETVAGWLESTFGTDFSHHYTDVGDNLNKAVTALTDAFSENIGSDFDALNAQFVLPTGGNFYYNSISFNSEDDMQADISGAQ